MMHETAKSEAPTPDQTPVVTPDKHPAAPSGQGASVIWKLILPVPLAIILGLVLAVFTIPPLLEENTEKDAISNAVQTVQQFKAIRAYYTSNIVKKVLKDGNLKPSINHATEEKSIPLPATFIHDMSALLKEQDTSFKLYSPYPFPNRADRKMDEFGKEAWAFLSANPDGRFVRQQEIDGRRTVRVAVADTMVADGCITCHNSRGDTPKKTWQLGDVRGVLEVVTTMDESLARGASLSNTILIATAAIGLVLTVIAVVFALGIAKPLQRMTSVMGDLARGNLDVTIPPARSDDEIGAIANAIQVFREQAIENETLQHAREKQQAEAAAERKARRQEEARHLQQEQEQAEQRAASSEQDRQTLIEKISGFEQKVGRIVQGVAEATAQMQVSSEAISVSVEGANRKTVEVATAIESASGNVDSAAGAAAELSNSIQDISTQVQASSDTARTAVERAKESRETVQGLVESAARIDQVISMITEIADQTNLLALNATIEAARVGEAGRGFAVVASEVKVLASETAKATEDISRQISDIQVSTAEAATAIDAIVGTIEQIDERSSAIASAVTQQAAATEGISENVKSVASSTQGVTADVGELTDAGSAASNATGQIMAATESLTGQVTGLRSELDSFLQNIRSA